MASLTSRTTPLDHRLAAHLLRRSSYVYTQERVTALVGLTPLQAVTQLTAAAPAPAFAEPIDYESGYPWINSGYSPALQNAQSRHVVRGWWLNEARLDTTINHKMQFFLHSNFVVAINEGPSAEYFDYLQLLRWGAIGNFKSLARKMIVDNQMLRYLDNKENSRVAPNENFAREFLELFTIGKGEQIGIGDYTNYTEADIVASAKVLTGWRVGDRAEHIDSDTNLPQGKPRYNRHARENSTFSDAFQGKTINAGTSDDDMHRVLDNYVDMIFAQAETAKHICRKLYRFFVNSKVSAEIEQDIITPLADIFRNNDYELLPVLTALLTSTHFYDDDDSSNTDEIIGSMIRSPLDLFLQTLTFFKVEVPDPQTDGEDHYFNFYKKFALDTFFEISGLRLFEPESVAGYPAYYQEPTFHRNWFNSSTIVARYKLGEMLLEGKRVLAGGDIGGVQLDMVDFVKNNISNPRSAGVVATELLEYLLPEVPDTDRRDYFLRVEFMNNLPLFDWTYAWDDYLESGNDEEVSIGLSNLLNAILRSPEYQMG